MPLYTGSIDEQMDLQWAKQNPDKVSSNEEIERRKKLASVGGLSSNECVYRDQLGQKRQLRNAILYIAAGKEYVVSGILYKCVEILNGQITMKPMSPNEHLDTIIIKDL